MVWDHLSRLLASAGDTLGDLTGSGVLPWTVVDLVGTTGRDEDPSSRDLEEAGERLLTDHIVVDSVVTHGLSFGECVTYHVFGVGRLKAKQSLLQ